MFIILYKNKFLRIICLLNINSAVYLMSVHRWRLFWDIRKHWGRPSDLRATETGILENSNNRYGISGDRSSLPSIYPSRSVILSCAIIMTLQSKAEDVQFTLYCVLARYNFCRDLFISCANNYVIIRSDYYFTHTQKKRAYGRYYWDKSHYLMKE